MMDVIWKLISFLSVVFGWFFTCSVAMVFKAELRNQKFVRAHVKTSATEMPM